MVEIKAAESIGGGGGDLVGLYADHYEM